MIYHCHHKLHQKKKEPPVTETHLLACHVNNSWDWIGHGLDKLLDVATSVFRLSYIKELVSWSRFGGCLP